MSQKFNKAKTTFRKSILGKQICTRPSRDVEGVAKSDGGKGRIAKKVNKNYL
jgi:hypothetical protein